MKKIFLSVILSFGLLVLFSVRGSAQYYNLFDFDGFVDGSYPNGSLISDGNFLYGMTTSGGIGNVGTIFRMLPDGSGFTKLLDFVWTNGSTPIGSLASDGTFLYGMTYYGGTENLGTIFKIMPDGSGYTNLLNFTDSLNGINPSGSLFYDGVFLYGMTQIGGSSNLGTIFKILPDGSGFVKLLDFNGITTGGIPCGSLISDGSCLYGMTFQSNTFANGGTIFKLMPDGSGYETLFDFSGTSVGLNPYGDLFYDGTALYGMTSMGGTNNQGTVFKIMPDGAGFITLINFAGVTNGCYPGGSIVSDGIYLYGTTNYGGIYNLGTIFRVLPDGSGYEKLKEFSGGSEGGMPIGSLVCDSVSVYGMTGAGGVSDMGVIFKYDYTSLGIDQNKLEPYLSVYPNPSSGIINMVSENEIQNGKLEILNMLGESIRTINHINLYPGENYSVDLSALDNGSYLIRLNNYQKMVIKN